MNTVFSVYTRGVIGIIEQFTLAEEELKQFVVYTYFSADGEPLYVGSSQSFYNTHYFNSLRLDFYNEVKYVGFVFFDNEADMKDAKKYYIRARNPKHARHRYKNLPLLDGLGVDDDDLVVLNEEMIQRWYEWLSS